MSHAGGSIFTLLSTTVCVEVLLLLDSVHHATLVQSVSGLRFFVESPVGSLLCLRCRISQDDFDYLFIALLLCDSANILHETARPALRHVSLYCWL